MQNTRTNKLETGDSKEELYEKIPEPFRGPSFEVGEVIKIKGYYYRVEELGENRLVFAPHGISKEGHPFKEHPKDALRREAAEVQEEIGRLDRRNP